MNLPPVCLSVVRSGLTALVCLSFTACTVLPPSFSNALPPIGSAPEPTEFRLSKEEVRRAYRSQRQIGVLELSAASIREQKATGRTPGTEYLATGGALLIKRYSPPILGKADVILVTPDFAELRGRSVVRKDNRLYIGQDSSARIFIEAALVRTEGLVSIKGIATAAEIAAAQAAPSPSPAAAPAAPLIPAGVQPAIIAPKVEETVPEAPEVKAEEPAPAPKRVTKKKTRPKAQAKPAPVVEDAPPPAVKRPEPAPVAKPTPPPEPKPVPAAKVAPKPEPKPTPAVDRDRLLKLMRPPTE